MEKQGRYQDDNSVVCRGIQEGGGVITLERVVDIAIIVLLICTVFFAIATGKLIFG